LAERAQILFPLFCIPLQEFGKFCCINLCVRSISGIHHLSQCYWLSNYLYRNLLSWKRQGVFKVIYSILMAIVIIFTSVANLLLKRGSTQTSHSKWNIYTNPYSILSYFIFAIVAFLSIYAMKGFDLKVFFALNSLTYICIPILSFIFLKESCTRNKMIGIIIISAGVIIFNF